LPSGRCIFYHNVKLEQGEWGDKLTIYNAIEHKWEYTWGGGLTENIVQAMSRDILMEAMLRLEPKWHTALRVHDELVLHVHKDQADKAKLDAVRELSVEPSWGPGLPLGAEAVISERYKK
jgi:DNA polymerase